ncbi:LysR family transcriptional regulator [Mycobacterium intracellulare]|uniref:LysR family transcriptional regulator n=1 Tax=Mycobacterium intracellulare TaxID=1767 RepID=UPI001EEE9C87|nr:LysR family transcriptional regulator [Mycobacterium intracellulare]MEE3751433.1 LysR family transcriptional regulator [Mycobacterium intracellulare]
MDMHRLRYFLRIADEGSLTRASEVLGIAQPALSRQIRLLEAALGVQLFARNPRGMQLTEEGEQLRSAIAGPLGQLELAMQNVGSPLAQIGGGVVLGMPEHTAQVLAGPLLGRLVEVFPKVQVTTVVQDSRQLVDHMLLGDVDIAVINGTGPDERLFTTELLVENLCLVGGPDSDLSADTPCVFRDLGRRPLTLPRSEPGLRSLVEKTALTQQVSVDVRFETDSVLVQRDVIGRGLAYGILPLSAIAQDVAAGRLRYAPLHEPTMSDHLFIAVRPQLVLPRSFVFEFGSTIWQVATRLVDAGDWPATLIQTPRDWAAQQAGGSGSGDGAHP